MTNIDLSKIKPGDEVTIRGRAIRNRHDDGKTWVEVSFENGPARFHHFTGPIAAESIATHTPKALSVGDRVKVRGRPIHTEPVIIAIDDDWAWLKDIEGDRWHVRLSGLERV